MNILLSVLLTVSIISNAALYYFGFKKKEKSMSMDARELLSELTSGSAILRVEVLDKGSLFLRSPRDAI